MLGYDLWQRLFSGDRNVLGRFIMLDDEPYKIIGVLPREAIFPDRAEIWVPLAPNASEGLNHGWGGHGIGRLKRGLTVQQASADLLRVHRSLIATGQKVNEITAPLLTSIRTRYLGDYRMASEILLVAVGGVLLIACVNIAALVLMRASSRSHEIGIRIAIGASRGRIIHQLLTENVVLAAIGGAVGVLFGRLGLQVIVPLLPDTIPGWIDFHLDARFVAFCILITASSAVSPKLPIPGPGAIPGGSFTADWGRGRRREPTRESGFSRRDRGHLRRGPRPRSTGAAEGGITLRFRSGTRLGFRIPQLLMRNLGSFGMV